MKINCSCSEDSVTTLVFPCSGAADVGEVSDRAGRELTRKGIGSMFCLAGIGGGVSGIIASTKAADKVLAIDGCPLDCAARTLEQAGITDFLHLRVTDCGMEKGKTEVSETNVSSVVDQSAKLL